MLAHSNEKHKDVNASTATQSAVITTAITRESALFQRVELLSHIEALKIDYAARLREDDADGASDTHEKLVETFDRFQAAEREEFFREVAVITRNATTSGDDIADAVMRKTVDARSPFLAAVHDALGINPNHWPAAWKEATA